MHLLMGVRGIKQVVDLWKVGMQGVWLPWQRTNLKTGKIEFSNVQMALRPIEFYDIVFPKEHLNAVLNSLKLPAGGKTTPNILNAYTGIMRKMLGLKPLPDEIPASATFPIFTEHIHFFPVGIKDDITEDCLFPNGEVYNQERL